MRYLPVLLVIGLEIFALIDCIQTSNDKARHLPKLAWILLIIFVPIAGAVAWLFAGRSRGAQVEYGRPAHPGGAIGRSSGPLGPDDDPDFLDQLRRRDAEHERMLKQWEEDLRKREREHRDDSGDNGDGRPSGK
jgi:Phospholipase_D-nuclease N-terminal